MPTILKKPFTEKRLCGLYQENGTCEECLALKTNLCLLIPTPEYIKSPKSKSKKRVLSNCNECYDSECLCRGTIGLGKCKAFIPNNWSKMEYKDNEWLSTFSN